jgi:hypothetical protein
LATLPKGDIGPIDDLQNTVCANKFTFSDRFKISLTRDNVKFVLGSLLALAFYFNYFGKIICEIKSADLAIKNTEECIKSFVAENIKSCIATFAVSVASAFVIAKIVDACLPENGVCLPEAEVVGNVSE